MRFVAAATFVAAMVAASTAAAQVGNPANPTVGRPLSGPVLGPPAPVAQPVLAPRTGPLPTRLTLTQALEEAAARSPTLVAAQADLQAAAARVRQAGVRSNPEISFELENFAGTGELRGLRSTEATLAVNQRLDLGGRRSARISAAQAELAVQQLRLGIARADLAQQVREQFARAATASERVAQATENVDRTRRFSRVAQILVDAGRDPPLRALRARSALAQAEAELEVAGAEELAARSSLASLLGASEPVAEVAGTLLDLTPQKISPETSLEVRLADAERQAAEAVLRQQLAERRLDPAVGMGVRHVRETGDFGLVAGVSMPLQVFDRNRGNIEAARAQVAAALSRRATAVATTTARARNAIAGVQAAQRRVDALEATAVPEATEALRLTERSYAEGRATLLELLDARNAYTATRTALTDARLALALATAELGRIAAQ